METTAATRSGTAEEIRPFKVDSTEEQIEEPRCSIAATPFPRGETVEDAAQGVQLATAEELARYWRGDYDMGRLQKRLGGNGYPGSRSRSRTAGSPPRGEPRSSHCADPRGRADTEGARHGSHSLDHRG